MDRRRQRNRQCDTRVNKRSSQHSPVRSADTSREPRGGLRKTQKIAPLADDIRSDARRRESNRDRGVLVERERNHSMSRGNCDTTLP